MTVKTTSATELTAEQVQRILVKPLEQGSTFLACGPRIFDTAGPIRIPKLGGMVDEGTTTPDEPDWIGEAELITKKDVDFGEVSLLPSTMKSVKVITTYSNEMARQSVVALDPVLQQRLVTDVAAKLDRQFWSATGDGITTPKGILAYSGVQEIDWENSPVDLDVLTDAWGMALGANVNMSGLRWIMRPETFVALRKIKEINGSARSVLTPDPTADAVFRLLGAPVTITSHLPLGPDGDDVDTEANEQTVVLADFSQIAVARDLAPSVTHHPDLYADYDLQAIRVVSRYDAAPLNPQSIVKIKNIVPE